MIEEHLIPAPATTGRSFSLVPTTLGEAMELAKMIAQSDMAPKDYAGKPNNIIIAIQMGLDVGLKPMQALQNIAVINGRPSIWGDAAVALVQRAEVLERFHETFEGTEGTDAFTAVCIIKRKGWADEIRRTFAVSDAKKAGLWTKSGPWQTYPKRMLQMRARAFALRDGASDVLMGLSIAEEAMDIPVVGQLPASESPAGEVTVSPGVAALRQLPEPVQENIEKAFATLNLAPGLRLAKLNEFLLTGEGTVDEKADRLLTWAKEEYAKRKGKTYADKKATDNGKKTPVMEPTVAQAASSAPVVPPVVTPQPLAAEAKLGF